jgi:hypothetical protein
MDFLRRRRRVLDTGDNDALAVGWAAGKGLCAVTAALCDHRRMLLLAVVVSLGIPAGPGLTNAGADDVAPAEPRDVADFEPAEAPDPGPGDERGVVVPPAAAGPDEPAAQVSDEAGEEPDEILEEPPAVDVVVAVGAAAGGALVGGALGGGAMLFAVQQSRQNPPGDTLPTNELFAGNAALTLGSLAFPLVLVIGGAAAGGAVGGAPSSVEVALTAAFGATAGAAAGAAIGVASGAAVSATSDPIASVALYGGLVAGLGALGAGLGAAGGAAGASGE